MSWQGVVLAGGKGTRLGELTRATNKHLLPVGPWPMVYHPVKKLIGAGIREILLTSGPDHLGDFVRLFGSGQAHQCTMFYRVQDEAGGIAHALLLAEPFCRGKNCVVLLGDNIFQDSLVPLLNRARKEPDRAWVCLKQVEDPTHYGVAEIQDNLIVSLEEKPAQPRGDQVVAGIYVFPPDVFDVIRGLRPSGRGELEITDVNRYYLARNRLSHVLLEGYWTDAGTPASLTRANCLVAQDWPKF